MVGVYIVDVAPTFFYLNNGKVDSCKPYHKFRINKIQPRSTMQIDIHDLQGLNDAQIIESREKYGWNKINLQKENRLIATIQRVLKEPMVILLLAAAMIYFVSGELGDGLFLAMAVLLISVISLYQESRSQIALEKLKKY